MPMLGKKNDNLERKAKNDTKPKNERHPDGNRKKRRASR